MSLLNGESSNLSVSIEGGAYLMHDDYLRKHGNFLWQGLDRCKTDLK